MNEIDFKFSWEESNWFEFIFYHSSLIWLNLTAKYFMIAYNDFVIFNFYEYYFL